MIGNSTAVPPTSAMSGSQRAWSSTESTETAIGLALRAANSPDSAAVRPSSVVQTGVKSAGWENSTAQAPSFHSWKLMRAGGRVGGEVGRGVAETDAHRITPRWDNG